MLGTGLGVYIPILLYLGSILVCILSIAWRPVLGIYVLLLIMPQQRLRFRLADMPLGEHLIVFILMSVIIGAALKGQWPRRSPLNIILVLFMGYTLLSLLFGTFTILSVPFFNRFSHWKDYMVMPMVFFATSATVRNRKQFLTVLVFACLSIFLVDRGFGLEITEKNFAHFDEDKRDAGPLGLGSNHTAAFEAETAFIVLALLASSKKLKVKLPLLGIAALNGFCILFAFSRAGYAGFLIPGLVLAWVRYKKLIPVIFVLLLAWEFVLPASVVERVTMTTDSSGHLESSAATRLDLWDDAMNLFLSDPVLGTGYDTYEYMGRVGSLTDTHNYYVKALVETGIIGFGFLVLLLWRFVQLGWRLFRTSGDKLFSSLGLGMALCALSMAITNLFGDRWSFVEINGIAWSLFGLVVYAQQETDRKVQPVSQPAVDEIGVKASPDWALSGV